MKRVQQMFVVLSGLAVAGLVAALLGVPAADTAALVGISFGVALVVGLVGREVLGRGRSRRLARQAVVVVLVAIAGTMLGAVVAAKAMFVSTHDLKALFVILVGAGIVGVLAALHLGDEVDRASRTLGDVTRRIGADEVAGPMVASSAPEELTRLARELETMGQRLNEARAREQRVEQSRRELIAWVSHDLRTPLAGIRAMVEALNDGVVDDPETTKRYLDTMQREADRLAGLVDDLFELSRIQADALRLRFEPIALAELVSDTLASAQVAAERKGVRLHGHVLDDAGVADLSIPEMGRVLRNLLENAIRHTPSGGTITVEVVGRTEAVEVLVADGCGGIPASDLDRVFELAYSGDAARSPGGGAGLGLAIAKGLVEAHRGAITVHNEDRGCCFVVRLPRSTWPDAIETEKATKRAPYDHLSP
jgi:signal transduction histidine kinase